MEGFEVKHAGSLVDVLVAEGGYSTRTKARKAIKYGAVKVEGEVVKIPSTDIQPGMIVKHDRGRRATPSSRIPAGSSSTSKAPFEIVYEDRNFLAYVKPAGWITASPKPQLSTTYSRMKAWLENESRDNNDLHFINKIEKDMSGICLIAKNREWREHLQNEWNEFRQGIYVMVEGHLPPDDELLCHEEDGEPVKVVYRTMRATQKHTLLKVDAPLEAFNLVMPALRRADCVVLGIGKSAPDPIKREGVHMFALEVFDMEGNEFMIKTRVPREFLNLVKGGDSPKPTHRKGRGVKFGAADRGARKLKQRTRNNNK